MVTPIVKVQIKFAKFLLGVNKKAVSLAVFSELGIYPVIINALKLSVGYWLHVIESKQGLLNETYKSNIQLPADLDVKLNCFLTS